ncbi:unnamed protein product [Cuscuta campestris]|uniref:Uncharacterized protein n=1 Tax=Cuscuta campestris TaxID=132261 RepID=A0A484NN82_9ASTE|nr:unnamed protein product [Cuscuta campestris]
MRAEMFRQCLRVATSASAAGEAFIPAGRTASSAPAMDGATASSAQSPATLHGKDATCNVTGERAVEAVAPSVAGAKDVVQP